MTYYLAIAIEDGAWTETFGDTDKECVDYEVYSWKEHAKQDGVALRVVRGSFPRVLTKRQLEAWAQGKV